MKSFKKLMIILISCTVVLMTAGMTYGYWDTLSFAGNPNFNIGEWMNGGIVAEASETVYNSIYNDWTVDSAGNLVVNEFNPVYANYTPEEIIEAIAAIEESQTSFLTTDGSSTSYLERPEAEYVELSSIGSLSPGQSVQIYKIVDFSEFSQDIYWAPVSLLVSLEQTEGYDISDYMVEVLIDYSAIQSLTYSVRCVDEENTLYNGLSYIGNVQASLTSAPSYYLTSPVNTVISVNAPTGAVNNGMPVTSLVRYSHTINKPTRTGNFGRLPQGSILSIDPPQLTWKNNNKYYPQYLVASNKTAQGVYTIGKPNGFRTVLRCGLDTHKLVTKNPNGGIYGNTLPIIINISRGKKVDANGNVLAQQNTRAAVPTVSYKLVKGQIYGTDI